VRRSRTSPAGSNTLSHETQSHLAALTGLSGQTVREQAEKAGFDLFFSKGVGFGELSAALVALAHERRHGR